MPEERNTIETKKEADAETKKDTNKKPQRSKT